MFSACGHDRLVPRHTCALKNSCADTVVRTTADYLDRLVKDLATLHGYVPFLINLFLQLFPPAEAIEFLEANDNPRPLTIRANTLKTRRKDLAQGNRQLPPPHPPPQPPPIRMRTPLPLATHLLRALSALAPQPAPLAIEARRHQEAAEAARR